MNLANFTFTAQILDNTHRATQAIKKPPSVGVYKQAISGGELDMMALFLGGIDREASAGDVCLNEQ